VVARFREHDRRRGRHARTQHLIAIGQPQTHRHRARLNVDAAADEFDGAVECAPRDRGQHDSRLGAHLHADGVALEGLHDQPHAREIGDLEQRLCRIDHLADRDRTLDHRAGHRRPQEEPRRIGSREIGGAEGLERRSGGLNFRLGD
jgi:hypothetical protein